jgi:outer membrane receptor protein involved in Fe transport
MPVKYLRSVSVCIIGAAYVTGAAAQTPPPAPETPKPPETVVVKGTPPKVINKVDRKVYRTAEDLQSTTGSATDILSNIPSVEVDPDGGVSLRGDSSVTILIDGKPSSQFQGAARGPALQSLSADSIQQIEVITSPSAEFKPDGSGGIINIVTKKNRKKPASAVIQANLGNSGRYGLNASGNFTRGPFDFSGGLGLRRDIRERDATAQTTTTDATTQLVTNGQQSNAQTENRRATTARAGVDYTINDRQSLSLSADYLERKESRTSRERSVNSGASTTAYERYNTGGGPRTNTNVALGFEQKFAREGESLSFNLQSGNDSESNSYDYLTQFSAPVATSNLSRQTSREAYQVSEFSTTWVRPLDSGSTLKLGYDVEYDRTGFDDQVANATPSTSVLIIDHTSDNRFRYRQTVNAAYATYDHKLGALELLGGLRFEQVDIDTRQNVSGDTGSQSYGRFYPTVNFVYNLSETDSITGGFSKRVQRPDPEDLNPYINTSDPHNLRQGNPDLKPQTTDSFELGYRYDNNGTSYQLTGYYRKSRNGDTEVLKVISSDVLLITKENLTDSQSGGVEFLTAGKFSSKLSYTLSGNLFYNEISAQSLGIAGTRSTVVLNTKTALDYKPTTTDRWQISANTNGKRLTPQGYVQPVATMNIGYRHQFSEKTALVATVSDVFDSGRYRRIFETPNFTGIYERRQHGQIAYLGLTYIFGAPKKDATFNYDQGG